MQDSVLFIVNSRHTLVSINKNITYGDENGYINASATATSCKGLFIRENISLARPTAERRDSIFQYNFLFLFRVEMTNATPLVK